MEKKRGRKPNYTSKRLVLLGNRMVQVNVLGVSTTEEGHITLQVQNKEWGINDKAYQWGKHPANYTGSSFVFKTPNEVRDYMVEHMVLLED